MWYQLEYYDDSGVTRVWDIAYIQRMGKMLGVFGAWPQDPKERPQHEPQGPQHEPQGPRQDEDDDGPTPWELVVPRPTPEKVAGGKWRRLLRVYVLLQGCLVFFLDTAFVVVRFGDLATLILGHAILTTLINFVHITRCMFFLTGRYYQLIEEYLARIHLFNHKDRNKYCQQVHSRVHSYCRALTAVTVAIFVIGIPAYNARPIINNVANGAYSGSGAEFQYSVYLIIPGVDLRHSLGPHIVMTVLNFGVSWFCVGSIWLPDLFAMQVVLHIGGHIDILRHEMKSFGEEMMLGLNGRLIFNDEESSIVNAKLKYFVNYHRKILRFVKMTNSTFREVYLVYFTYFQVSLCIMMWQCSQGMQGLLQYGMLLSASVLSLALLCVVLEMIGTESELLEAAVYGLPWQYMRPPARRVLLVMLHRAQAPLRMKVLGINDIGVATLAAILKTSISYFMLLRSVD